MGGKWGESERLLRVTRLVSDSHGQHILQSPYSLWAEIAVGSGGGKGETGCGKTGRQELPTDGNPQM